MHFCRLAMTTAGICAGLLCTSHAPAAGAKIPKKMRGMPLVFSEDFESSKTDRWAPTDPKAWKIEEVEGNKCFAQFQGSKYKPKVRSPHNIAWLKDVSVSDFVLDAKMWQTGRDYGHRDMCIFFGKQDPEHFYYVHIATKADPHANNIFIVNGKPRTAIAKKTTKGTDWGKGWHHVRIVRKVDDGTIRVFFDDMKKPIMIAEDKTFESGPIGFGTFDDTGRIDDVRLWGKKAEKK